MKISRDEAARIAVLARLRFDDAALERLAGEMTEILEYIDRLGELPLDALPPAEPLPTPFREDEVRPSLDREDVARNAPSFAAGFFVVPKVIGGE